LANTYWGKLKFTGRNWIYTVATHLFLAKKNRFLMLGLTVSKGVGLLCQESLGGLMKMKIPRAHHRPIETLWEKSSGIKHHE
jgi:hypothetical protein